MLSEGKWISAQELVRLIHTHIQGVLQKLPSSGQLSPTLARSLHDASLLGCMFGYIPPCRLTCLRTMQTPHARGCHTEDCQKEACRGNRLELSTDGKLSMVFSHYKVDEK